jgi:hypothetical protein
LLHPHKYLRYWSRLQWQNTFLESWYIGFKDESDGTCGKHSDVLSLLFTSKMKASQKLTCLLQIHVRRMSTNSRSKQQIMKCNHILTILSPCDLSEWYQRYQELFYVDDLYVGRGPGACLSV